jgi:DNA invertase Pin-like site-specific DNA recombinase
MTKRPKLPPDTETSETLRIGYARVSTSDQDLSLQLDALHRDGIDRIYQEHASSAAKRRPQFDAMMKDVRAGDVVTVWKLDRLGRSLRQVLDTVKTIHDRGAKLRILTQQIDTSTPMGGFILAVFGAFGELERELIRDRTRAGLAAAAERGRKGGRRPTFTDRQVLNVRALVVKGANVKEACKSIGISPQQYERRMAALKEKNK